MPDYQLHTLSHRRFERLVNRVGSDLLGIGLTTFAEGRDQGIDGAFEGTAQRYPSAKDPWRGRTIVQAKHTSEAGASCGDASFGRILATEAAKIRKLHDGGRCDNYLLVTNRKLTAKTHGDRVEYLRDETRVGAAGLLGIERLSELLAGAAEDATLVAELVAPLLRYSLARREVDADAVSVHRLLQAVILDSMGTTERIGWTERAVGAVAAAFPWPEPRTWPSCRRLHLHALAALDDAERQAVESTEVARLAGSVASFADDRAAYQEAEPLYKRSLEIQEKALEPDHPEVAVTLNNLGSLYADQGRTQEAEPLYKRSLEIKEKYFGDEHPSVARTLENYADLLDHMEADGSLRTASRRPEILEVRRRAQALRDANR